MHENLLPDVVAAAFGTDRRLDTVTRLHGGSKKGAYRLTLDDGFTAVFLRIRFGEHYAPLYREGLDEARLRLYRLAQHLSLVAGPLRLLDGAFPDRDFMLGIATHHTGEALSFLP